MTVHWPQRWHVEWYIEIYHQYLLAHPTPSIKNSIAQGMINWLIHSQLATNILILSKRGTASDLQDRLILQGMEHKVHRNLLLKYSLGRLLIRKKLWI